MNNETSRIMGSGLGKLGIIVTMKNDTPRISIDKVGLNVNVAVRNTAKVTAARIREVILA
jgi:hypothetical protein